MLSSLVVKMFLSNAYCQLTYFKYQIYLDVSNGYLLYASNNRDSSSVNQYCSECNESKSIKIFNTSGRGTLNFRLSDTVNGLFIQGQYLETNLVKTDTSKIIRKGMRVHSTREQPTTSEYYYRPMRDGEWYYYDISGKVIKIEKYEKGRIKK